MARFAVRGERITGTPFFFALVRHYCARMLTVEVLAQRDLDPAASQVLDMHWLELAPRDHRRARLRIYTLAGEVVSLGRYHLAPVADAAAGVAVHRRRGGGRVVPLGPGFAALSLTLPHRSALVAEEPLALRPEQALNRCTRALLGGLRALGVDAFYPGRDRITVDRRLLGVVSLETDAQGTAMFEAVVALDGDWLSLPERLAKVDGEGRIAAAVLSADEVTTLAACGVTATVEELTHCVAGSYAEQFGLELTAGTAPPVPPDTVERAAVWIASRRLRPGLDRHAVAWGQLGVIEVHLAVDGDAIADVLLCGDFIADSPAIDQLELRLRGCALTRAAIGSVVDAVYAEPRSFLLGVGPLQTTGAGRAATGAAATLIVDTILRAA